MIRPTPVHPSRPQDIVSGTRVQGRASGRVGIVQPHRPNQTGTFSVRWLDGSQLWEVVTADDVHVIAATAAGAA